MFKNGDYIVLTEANIDLDNSSFSLNFCYKSNSKSRENYYLQVDKDDTGLENGWSDCQFDNKGRIKWRYATVEEAFEYNRLGEPFDTSTLENKINTIVPGTIYKITFEGNEKGIIVEATEHFVLGKGSRDNSVNFINVESGLYTRKGSCCSSKTLVFTVIEASKEEKQWLNACIKANKFIPREEALKKAKSNYQYEVVHCETQEQWDIVTEKLGYKWGKNISLKTAHKDKTCIDLIVAQYGSRGYFERYISKIYSFEEWCKEFDVEIPKTDPEEFKVGDWVKITKSNKNWHRDMDKYIGKIVQITSVREAVYKANGQVVQFKDDKEDWTWSSGCDHFVKVSAPIESKSNIDAKDVKVGDYLEFNDSGGLIVSSGTRGLELNKPFKIIDIEEHEIYRVIVTLESKVKVAIGKTLGTDYSKYFKKVEKESKNNGFDVLGMSNHLNEIYKHVGDSPKNMMHYPIVDYDSFLGNSPMGKFIPSKWASADPENISIPSVREYAMNQVTVQIKPIPGVEIPKKKQVVDKVSALKVSKFNITI